MLNIIITVSGIALLSWLIISPEIQRLWVKVFFVALTLTSGLFYLPELVVGLFRTKLVLLDTGIILRRAFFEMYCEWDKVSGFAMDHDELRLICDKEVTITNKGYFGYSMWPKTIIPLHLFIRKWRRIKIENIHPVLLALSHHRPDLIHLNIPVE